VLLLDVVADDHGHIGANLAVAGRGMFMGTILPRTNSVLNPSSGSLAYWSAVISGVRVVGMNTTSSIPA
jgi:hypothetical protein